VAREKEFRVEECGTSASARKVKKDGSRKLKTKISLINPSLWVSSLGNSAIIGLVVFPMFGIRMELSAEGAA
jgi:hypothetical protein